ncbi:MAG: pyrroline-5-carboxylate reductase [Candidatus Omnitrophota bacterium]|nr:pyrroline-5-carboxylate reductase [Candidatus Omnitrophota bacterium]
MTNKKIGIIGCGNMGEALIRGMLAEKLAAPGDILISDKSNEREDCIKSKFNVNAADSGRALVINSDVIILAVKPRDIGQLLQGLADMFKPGQLMVSIVAGITTVNIQRLINAKLNLVRVMPNSPALINQAISAVYYGPGIKEADKAIVGSIFNCLGEVVEVEESLMDGVTAISGSGPAYFFLLIKYLIAMGIKFGLTEKIAARLALQTALGSARMALEVEEDIDVLIKKVTSKGGTTEAALKVFEEMKIKEIYSKAVEAARSRAGELFGG